ncbi:hypothetical protein SUGI_0776940 [Cryptomeria japonica]|nr:hypothetical protein SUGI_0776940 [Cryptomeria japonica]
MDMDSAASLSVHAMSPSDKDIEEESDGNIVDCLSVEELEKENGFEIELGNTNHSGFSTDYIDECNWANDVLFMCESLVGRFTCIKPSVQDLCNWSKKHWGPKLRSIWTFETLSNGFFRVDFFSQLDCQFVMENGPWFMGSSGLSLKCWSPDFDPKNPGPIGVPIWVKLVYFPCDSWFQSNLIKVCAAIGKVLKISEVSKKRRSLTAKVCVEMDISKSLPSTVSLYYHGVVYTGVLHYEGMPFRCKICHSSEHHKGCCSQDKKMKKHMKIAKDGLRKKEKIHKEHMKNVEVKDLTEEPNMG